MIIIWTLCVHNVLIFSHSFFLLEFLNICIHNNLKSEFALYVYLHKSQNVSMCLKKIWIYKQIWVHKFLIWFLIILITAKKKSSYQSVYWFVNGECNLIFLNYEFWICDFFWFLFMKFGICNQFFSWNLKSNFMYS